MQGDFLSGQKLSVGIWTEASQTNQLDPYGRTNAWGWNSTLEAWRFYAPVILAHSRNVSLLVYITISAEPERSPDYAVFVFLHHHVAKKVETTTCWILVRSHAAPLRLPIGKPPLLIIAELHVKKKKIVPAFGWMGGFEKIRRPAVRRMPRYRLCLPRVRWAGDAIWKKCARKSGSVPTPQWQTKFVVLWTLRYIQCISQLLIITGLPPSHIGRKHASLEDTFLFNDMRLRQW